MKIHIADNKSCSLLIVCLLAFVPVLVSAQDDEDAIHTPGRMISVNDVDRGRGTVDRGLYIVRFESEPSDELLEVLSRRGFAVREYLARNTYWVQAPGGDDLADVAEVRALVKADTVDKISPSLNRLLAARPMGEFLVTVKFFDSCRPSEISRLTNELGLTRRAGKLLYGKRMQITLSREQLGELAKSEMVNVIESGPRPRKPLNLNTAGYINVVEAKEEFGLDGDGVTVGIWDGGAVAANHRELNGRVTIAEPGEVSGHATHVAGTIGATGMKRTAEGMAPACEIVSYNFEGDVPTEMANARQKHLINISNNSWGHRIGWEYIYFNSFFGYIWAWFGDEDFGRYTSEAAAYDKLVYEKGIHIIFAAGNHGTDFASGIVYYDALADELIFGDFRGSDTSRKTIEPNASAKNVIAVGSTRKDDRESVYSCYGPTKDNRVKPEVMAPGEGIYSTLPGGKYGKKSGTSMATPAVTGGIALLIQQWRSVHGKPPSPAVIRSIIAATARNFDYKWMIQSDTGFGILDVEAAAYLIEKTATDKLVIEKALKKNKRTRKHRFSVAPKSKIARICVAWTDPPAQPDAPKTLVNDINIKLWDPEGTLYLPWTHVIKKNTGAWERGVNREDNIEVISVRLPTAGKWRLEVSIDNFGKGSRQKYALTINVQ